MNHGVIIGFFVSFFQKLIHCFHHSVFYKLQKQVKRFWLFITENSCIVNFFKNTFSDRSILDNSVIFRVLRKIAGGLSRGVQKVKICAMQSRLFVTVKDSYRYFFHVNLRVYAVGGLTLACGYFITSLIRYQNGGKYFMFMLVLSVVSALGVMINRSAAQMLSGSGICHVGKKVLLLPDNRYDTVTTSAQTRFYRLYFVLGVVGGIASGMTQTLYVPVIFAGMFVLGFVLYDYRIAVFSALIAMPFLPTMAVVGLVLLGAVSFALKWLWDENFSYVRTALDIPLAVFAGIMLISAVSSFARGNSIQIFMVYGAFVLAYYLCVNAIRTKQQLTTLLTVMLLAAIGVSAYGIYQHIFGFAGGTTWTDTTMFTDIETRVVSTFENPNVLGEYLLLFIPVAVGFFFGHKKGGQKGLNLLAAAVLGLCMIYTYSRGNWIGLICAVLLFFMFYDGRFVWLGMLLVFFLPMFLPQNVIDRMLSVGNTADTSTSYRVWIWLGTLSMLKDYWACGIGLGSEAYNTIYPFYSYAGIVAPHSHSLYLQIITENGILGLIAFIALIAVYYKMVISAVLRTKDKMLKVTLLGLSTGMFGYLIQGFFDNVWYNYRIVYLFFVILALSAACVNFIKAEKTKKKEKCAHD